MRSIFSLAGPAKTVIIHCPLLKNLTMSTEKGRRPVTRAKNATQHPGQVVINAQSKRRGVEEMEKVRAQERFDIQVAERRLHAALKSVARIQDKHQTEDVRAQQPVIAPSLRHRGATLPPGRLQVVPGAADDDSEAEGEEYHVGSLLATVVSEGEGDTELDKWFDSDPKEPEEVPSDKDEDDIEEGQGQGQRRTKKKKRGDGLPALVDSMRKHPIGPKKHNVNLVNKVPPTPTPKGKRPRGVYVFRILPHFLSHFFTIMLE